MGKVNQLWQDEVNAIGESYAAGRLTEAEARKKLAAKNFEPDEIGDMLAAAEPSLCAPGVPAAKRPALRVVK